MREQVHMLLFGGQHEEIVRMLEERDKEIARLRALLEQGDSAGRRDGDGSASALGGER